MSYLLNKYIKNKENKGFHESWKISCEDGIHEIRIEGTTHTTPIKLFIDDKHIDTIHFKRKSILHKFEYKFTCADEDVILIFVAGKYDIVHRGILQKANLKYEPKSVLPRFYRIFSIVLIFLSITPAFFSGIKFTVDNASLLIWTILAPCCCSLFCESSATNPFYSKKKKILISVVSIVLAWLTNVVSAWLLLFIRA
ncbi:MAG: hypothetical protein J6A83_06380 [Clostridia bacterium]|nr:hypothetical protein [Clostridia bacterium]